jgi:Ceramidase
MESHWSAPIDGYCERTDASFWSEPVNALSNAGFMVAAAVLFARWRRAGGRDWPALYLIIVVAVVGTGSFLFHTFANRWSQLADVVPIAIFIYSYFLLAMRRFVGLGIVPAVVLTLGFAAFSFGFQRVFVLLFGVRGLELTNTSVGYVPAALALFGVGAALLRLARATPLRREAGRALLRAAVLFAISLSFRTVDRAFCPAWPLGTHFVWHVLNALLLFMLVDAATRFRSAAGRV